MEHKLKLLILSFYYPPDLSACSFRTHALIKALEDYRQQGLEVDILTTQPNRYSEIATSVKESEDYGWLRIRRVNLPAHRSGMRDQAKAFLNYAKAVRNLTNDGNWDMVYATSSRLMTAALGAYVARRLRVPLYLDIRDIFTDTMHDVLTDRTLRQILPIFRWLERRTFKTATRINVVSAGFLNHIYQIVPHLRCSVFTNGIDSDFLTTDFRKEPTGYDLPVILYAGNIGEGQGLHRIIPDAAVALTGTARFHIIGGGGRLSQLKSALVSTTITNVDLYPPVPRSELLNEYRTADILFLHLNDHAAFLKVLPSKIFEYAATGKPIVAGVSGYAADFLRNEVPGAQIFDPCDVQGMVRAIIQVLNTTELIDRSAFCATFDRAAIMDSMAVDILSTLRSNSHSLCLEPSEKTRASNE